MSGNSLWLDLFSFNAYGPAELSNCDFDPDYGAICHPAQASRHRLFKPPSARKASRDTHPPGPESSPTKLARSASRSVWRCARDFFGGKSA